MTISAKAHSTPATMTPTLLVVLVGILSTGSEGRDSEREKKTQSIVFRPVSVTVIVRLWLPGKSCGELKYDEFISGRLSFTRASSIFDTGGPPSIL